MLSIIRWIDCSLKKLYRNELQYRAEDFMVRHPPRKFSLGAQIVLVENPNLQGAVFVRADKGTSELNVGIYLNPSIQQGLSSLSPDQAVAWSKDQLEAFSVATEEISHFQYFIYRVLRERGISHLELELQGEVDKFLLTYFAQRPHVEDPEELFDALFDEFFDRFSLNKDLAVDQRERYLEANRLAKRFLRRCRSYLEDPRKYEKGLRLLRKFYRLSSAEKISFISCGA